MREKKRAFVVRFNYADGDIHPGNVEEMQSSRAAIEQAYRDVSDGKFTAVAFVVVSEGGTIHTTNKISVHSERNGAWEDGTRITPSQTWDAVTNYIRMEEDAAKQADSV